MIFGSINLQRSYAALNGPVLPDAGCGGTGRKIRARVAGSSLVEVMMGVLVLGLVFGTAFSTIGQGFILVENGRDNTRVSQILQAEMENLRVLTWTGIEAIANNSTWTPSTEFGAAAVARYTCQRKVTTTQTATSGAATQKAIILRVTWTDSQGISRSRKYMTKFTKGGINAFYYGSF